MPSWSIHLKIGKELLKNNNLDKDKFLFGSLIPDTDEDWGFKRFNAHYYGNLKFPKCPHENMIDINSFKNDYSKVLDDDLIKGYYVHLLIDNYYNEYIYYNKWIMEDDKIVGIKTITGDIIDVRDNYHLTGKYKHRDLELYGKRIFENEEVILPDNIEVIGESINKLKNKFLNIDKVKRRIEYLKGDFINTYLKEKEEEKNSEYLLFNKDELDQLLNDCIKYINEVLDDEG